MKQGKATYKSTHGRLTAEGFSPEQPLMSRTKISTMEKGKRYALVTKEGEESVVYAIDGNIIKQGVDTHKKFPHIVIKKGTTFSSVQK